MNSFTVVRDCIYERGCIDQHQGLLDVVNGVEALAVRAYRERDEAALLEANRILYAINLAHLSQPWVRAAHNVAHLHIARIKFVLERAWEQAERDRYAERLSNLPDAGTFVEWITELVRGHSAHDVHQLYYFLRDSATFQQLRWFTLQETPLEMLFGDIVALMMPGVYGGIKEELAKNFWDEVGHAQDAAVHRNMRATLMREIDIDPASYEHDIEIFVREELSLINTYLSIAMNRASLTQMTGVMLATELMIPGRFEFLIAGWKRLELRTEALTYLTEHVTVDAEHAQDWLYKVVKPMIADEPAVMGDLVLGVLRRLDTAAAVSDRLMAELKH